jgi:PAS domain-containing protein
MDSALQADVIPVFHYSLVRGGILLLGGSESAAQHGELFEPLDEAARIFLRRDVKSPALNLTLHEPQRMMPRTSRYPPTPRPLRGENPADAKPVSTGSIRANSASEPDAAANTAGSQDGSGKSQRSLFRRSIAALVPHSKRSARSQSDLFSTREKLQSLGEEHQTALEELRSANEELHSVNEEMQSTNEELETSKEELQSLNEELHTVNLRLSEKVEELDEFNSDLRNLFESTEIATIFLDRHLIIRSFTPAIATLYNLIPSDAGRPLTDIVSRLDYDSMSEDVTRVLDTLQPLEKQIARFDRAAHYIMRILPYREPDSTVSGALVTFVDVTSIVQAEDA